MTLVKLRRIIAECCNDVIFVYGGLESGITSEVHDYVPTFQAWHGDKTKTYSNVEELLFDGFYDGKSIADIIGEVDFKFA